MVVCAIRCFNFSLVVCFTESPARSSGTVTWGLTAVDWTTASDD